MIRVLSALALLSIVVGVIWLLPSIWTLIVVEAILLRAVVEYSEIGVRTGVSFSRVTTATSAMATCAAFSLAPSQFPIVLMTAAVGIALVELAQRGRQSIFTSVSVAVFSLPYLAIPLGSMAALRSQAAPEVLLLLVATVVASDTSQYYGGRAIGKHPLAPVISPKKTIEGAFFGFVAGIVVMGILGHWWLPGVGLVLRLMLGAMVAGLGIAGDLFESNLKRGARLKDASSVIPGHGGVLDRLDGFLFAAPVYYAVVVLTR
jgi:phosphatidate cytidylyltransferase